MSRPLRMLRNAAIALGVSIAVLAMAAVPILQSSWFQNYVKRTIVASVEDSTGGKAEIGSFHLEWTRLTAVATDFVIHGTEAADATPLLRVARVQLNLRLFTSLHHLWDITYLGVDRPQANVIVFADGHTNIPSPRKKSASKPLETVVDLAIGRFELTHGTVAFGARKQELNIRANNLLAQLSYNILSGEYRGQISLQPIYVVSSRKTPVNFTVNLPVVLSRNRIEVRDARIASPLSAITVNASMADLRNPTWSAHAVGHIALADLKSVANVALPLNTPPVIDLDANARVVNADVHVDIQRLSLGGANVGGTADLDSQGAYSIHGNLKDLVISTALRASGQTRLPYDGVLSGPIDIAGNLHAGWPGLTAQAKVSIKPGSHGVPLSGNLTAAYSGGTDDVSIQSSRLTLPNSRLSVDGSIGKQLNIAISTTNLDDLFAALPKASRPQVALRGGQATFQGTVTGSLTAPKISGHLMANRFSVAERQFDNLSADVSATGQRVAIQNGSLARGVMQTGFSGTLGLRDWKALPSAPLAINASIQNGDLADLLALAGQPSKAYSGQLSANASIDGTLGNRRGAGSLAVTHGVILGQPFDRAEAQINLTDQLLTVPSAFVQLGSARLNFAGQFQHPRDSFTSGQLHADLESDRIDLAQLAELQKQRPNTVGAIQLRASVNGNFSGEFQLTGINGNASVRGLQSQGLNYGDLTATAGTSGQRVSYNLTSNFAGANITASGATDLTRDYPTTASANLTNLPVERLLSLANRTDIRITGMLSGTANFSGTASNPTAAADLTLTRGTIYEDAVDRVHARVNYQPQSIDVPQLELVSGSSRVNLTARYDHPAGNLESGNLQFRVDTGAIDLARVKTLATERPRLSGTLRANASGEAQVRAAEPRILVQNINGGVQTTGLTLNGKSLGDLTLKADTAGGRTNFTLTSSIAGASLEGRGSVQLANDYSTDAQVTFKNLTWAGLRPLLGFQAEQGRGFEAVGDGQASLSGPLMSPQQLRGSVQVTRLEVSGAPSGFRQAKATVLHNRGSIAATLDSGTLKIQTAHLTGSQTDFQATGVVPLSGDAMDLALKGNVNLAILQQFDQFITSSGDILLSASVRGSVAKPRLTGQVELRNASFNYPELPTGLWRANGVIALSGDSAVIRNLTAEAGGGQVVVTGSARLNGALRFALQAKASQVRMMVQQGVGVVASGNVTLSGTPENSSVSGVVTVDQISYNSRTDLGSILSLAAPPVQAPSVPSPLLENMRLDIRVRSSPALGLRSALAQNLQLTADLRVRGSAAYPGVLGRVLITEGKLVFFGSTYTVNNGSIAFYNPVRVEPILDLSLETQTQGVDVVLKVTGPIDNMKLSYTSDPPLQFQEIVNLLATGTTPTSDPTLLANQPALPAQSFQQLGESAIVSRALADPVTNQLQRVFGVTQLKINPAFTSGSQLPEAQLSLQQQISNNVTFTYVTGLNTANAETIQVLWTFTPQWSAEALRDYNGIFSVTLTYKKQFH